MLWPTLSFQMMTFFGPIFWIILNISICCFFFLNMELQITCKAPGCLPFLENCVRTETEITKNNNEITGRALIFPSAPVAMTSLTSFTWCCGCRWSRWSPLTMWDRWGQWLLKHHINNVWEHRTSGRGFTGKYFFFSFCFCFAAILYQFQFLLNFLNLPTFSASQTFLPLSPLPPLFRILFPLS